MLDVDVFYICIKIIDCTYNDSNFLYLSKDRLFSRIICFQTSIYDSYLFDNLSYQ